MNHTTTLFPSSTSGTMSWEASVVTATLIVMTASLIFNVVTAASAMVLSSAFLVLCGILTTSEIFSGLGNGGTVSIVLMNIIVQPVADLPTVKRIVRRMLVGSDGEGSGAGTQPSVRFLLLKFLIFTGMVSVFVDNGSQVALFTALVAAAAEEHGLPISQILMPMVFMTSASNGSIVACAQNLVAQSIMEKFHIDIGFFELMKVCGPTAVVILTYLVSCAPLILSSEVRTHGSTTSTSKDGRSRFCLTYRVPTIVDPAHQGVTLRSLNTEIPEITVKNVSVIEISRAATGERLHDIHEDTLLYAGDIIIVSGKMEHVRTWRRLTRMILMGCGHNRVDTEPTAADATEEDVHLEPERLGGGGGDDAMIALRTPKPPAGLALIKILEKGPLETSPGSFFTEITLSSECPGVGRRVDDGTLQKEFECHILSILPRGSHDCLFGTAMNSHILTEGDTILIRTETYFSHPEHYFYGVFHQNHMFVPRSVAAQYITVPNSVPTNLLQFFRLTSFRSWDGTHVRLPFWHAYTPVVVFLGVICGAIIGYSVAMCTLLGVIVNIATKITTVKDVYIALDWNLLISSAFSFGIGNGMMTSGLAAMLGASLANSNANEFALLLTISVLTSLLSNTVTARVAVQVMIPIAIQVMRARMLDPLAACVVVINSCPSSFLSYYGQVTNLMIFGPGRYKPVDFLKFGGPMFVVFHLCNAG
eukprot:PhF_6_TR37577/c0_g1_i2/m.55736